MRSKKFRSTLITFGIVIAAFIACQVMISTGAMTRSLKGQLVPICAYVVMAVSLNLTVGISGELSLGHAGFMSVGAFSGIVVSQSLAGLIPNGPVRLALSMFIGALLAALVGLLIGTPVLRLQGDYLAIVTLAFGEIIKELINCLIIGCDEKGLHFVFNLSGNKTVDDLFSEIGGEVENEIRHSEVHCNRARVLDVVKRTAGVLLRHSGVLIIVQLHRASDAFVTLFGKERGADA